MHPYEILTLTTGHPRYADVILRAADDPVLTDAMWRDGEIEWELGDATTWWVAVPTGGSEVLAMCAARADWRGGRTVMVCRANYEVRRHRGRGLYAAVYAARHLVIRGYEAETWIFDQPLPLHLADGWVRTGEEGTSRVLGLDEHHWQGLRRSAGDLG